MCGRSSPLTSSFGTYKIVGRFLKCTFPRFDGTFVFRSAIEERPRTFRAQETHSKVALLQLTLKLRAISKPVFADL
jgi:hypothetical protein